jgi:hypothetical protein
MHGMKKEGGTVSAPSGPTELDRRLALGMLDLPSVMLVLAFDLLKTTTLFCMTWITLKHHRIERFPPLATDHCLAFPVIILVPPR